MNTLICDKRRYSAPGQKIPIFQEYFRKYQMATGGLKHIYRVMYRV